MAMRIQMNSLTLYISEYTALSNCQQKNNLNKRFKDTLKLNNCLLNNQIFN